MPESFAIV